MTNQKNLTYTKQMYREIIKSAWDALQKAKESGNTNIELESGLYYESFIGMIRAGAMIERRKASDGTPIILISTEDDIYQCEEPIIRDLLGSEAEELISPYVSDEFGYYQRGKINPSQEDDIQIPDTIQKKRFTDNFGLSGDKGKKKKTESDSGAEDSSDIYDPSYDHMYDDTLPDLVKRAQDIVTEQILLTVTTIVSLAGVVISLLYLF